MEESESDSIINTDRLFPRNPDGVDGGGSDGGDGLRRGLRREDHRGQACDHEPYAKESVVPQSGGGTRRKTPRIMCQICGAQLQTVHICECMSNKDDGLIMDYLERLPHPF